MITAPLGRVEQNATRTACAVRSRQESEAQLRRVAPCIASHCGSLARGIGSVRRRTSGTGLPRNDIGSELRPRRGRCRKGIGLRDAWTRGAVAAQHHLSLQAPLKPAWLSRVLVAPDPTVVHPVAGQPRVVFLRPLIKSATVEIGEYTYYDDPDSPEDFERKAVLYAFGPERLVIGRFCALAAGVRFFMPGANHADHGSSTFPFGIFGDPWAGTMDLLLATPSRGDTIVGSDVWFGNGATVLPGVRVGHGAVVAASSVVASDVPPYSVVAGNPARVVRRRFDDHEVDLLLEAAWWDWPLEAVTRHARTIMAGTPGELARIATELRG